MAKLRPRVAIFDNWDARILMRPYTAMGIEVVPIATVSEARTFEFHFLVLGGGADVNPTYYGEPKVHASVTDQSRQRDRVEWVLVRRALAARIPTLGICRGHQMLAVAAGATLVQDVVYLGYTDRDHRKGTHPIEFMDGPLGKLIGFMQVVNSYHHQAVANVPVGWTTAAVSDDGLIEAMYHPGFLGVQWHPERLCGSRNKQEDEWPHLVEWHLSGFKARSRK